MSGGGGAGITDLLLFGSAFEFDSPFGFRLGQPARSKVTAIKHDVNKSLIHTSFRYDGRSGDLVCPVRIVSDLWASVHQSSEGVLPEASPAGLPAAISLIGNSARVIRPER